VPVLAANILPDPALKLAGKKVLAFAGIGRPEKFFATLTAAGAEVKETHSFPDHHRFSAREARRLLAAAEAKSLAPVTTEKDFARMQGDPALAKLAESVTALPVRVKFADDGAVRKLLEQALARGRA
jgi:tetraacyldisaccharide 4'-kinase